MKPSTTDSPGTTPAVAIVCVTYNRCEPLLLLLGQLRSIDYELSNLDIYLVDNASTDETVPRVRSDFPEVHVVQNNTNTGVSAGFNRSIQEALSAPRDYQYLWLLDSDAEVESSTLRRMIESMEEQDNIGVAGSAVYDPEMRGKLVTTGLRVDWQRGDIPLFTPDKNDHPALLDVDLIPACSMLTRASLYRDVGLWDDRFPLYWGDTDWCTRVKQAGHRVCCVPASRVWHRDWSNVAREFGGGGFIRDHVRGALLYFVRHAPDVTHRGARQLLIRTLLKAGLERLAMRRSYCLAYRQAVDDLLTGNFQPGLTGRRPPDNQPVALDHAAKHLAGCLPARVTVLLNQLENTALRERITTVFGTHFPNASWQELPAEPRDDATWSEYRLLKPGQLLRFILYKARNFGHVDINVCHVSNPLLYNFMAGRYTLLVDDTGNATIERNHMIGTACAALGSIFRALRSAYIDLPRALKSNPDLHRAIAVPETHTGLPAADGTSVPDV